MIIRPYGEDETVLTRRDCPSWDSDGSLLVFFHNGGIWTIDADGSNLRMLVLNGESFAWSRDRKMIAFTRAVPCGKPACKERVFVVGATGGTPKGIGSAFVAPRSLVWLPDPF